MFWFTSCWQGFCLSQTNMAMSKSSFIATVLLDMTAFPDKVVRLELRFGRCVINKHQVETPDIQTFKETQTFEKKKKSSVFKNNLAVLPIEVNMFYGQRECKIKPFIIILLNKVYSLLVWTFFPILLQRWVICQETSWCWQVTWSMKLLTAAPSALIGPWCSWKCNNIMYAISGGGSKVQQEGAEDFEAVWSGGWNTSLGDKGSVPSSTTPLHGLGNVG